MDFEWDEHKRQSVLLARRVDLLYAALIFEGPVLTRVDDRQPYGEARWISIGLVADECLVVVHTERDGARGSSQPGKEDAMTGTSKKRASLAEIRRMNESGQLAHDPGAPEGEELGADFWQAAAVEQPPRRRSVHLKLDADVFEFFRQGSRRARSHHPHAGRAQGLCESAAGRRRPLDASYPTAFAIARPAERPENRQPPRNVPSRAR
jgi:uncharacterized DUF497 family protein